MNMQNNIFSDTKRMFYEAFVEDIHSIVNIGTEIAGIIPNCKLYGINKDHNGINLSFLCDSVNVTKSDIDNAAVHAIKLFFQTKCIHINNNELIRYISDENNLKSLFHTMQIAGTSFSVII